MSVVKTVNGMTGEVVLTGNNVNASSNIRKPIEEIISGTGGDYSAVYQPDPDGDPGDYMLVLEKRG